jgi:hypothetical protein
MEISIGFIDFISVFIVFTACTIFSLRFWVLKEVCMWTYFFMAMFILCYGMLLYRFILCLVLSEVVLSEVHGDLTHAQMVVLTSGSIIQLERVMSVTCRLVAGKEKCAFIMFICGFKLVYSTHVCFLVLTVISFRVLCLFHS